MAPRSWRDRHQFFYEFIRKVAGGETLSQEEKDALSDILRYHVVSGEVLAADVTDNDDVATIADDSQSIETIATGGVAVKGDANASSIPVTEADLKVSNGVIHGVESVILP